MFGKKKEKRILVKFTLHDSIEKDTPKYWSGCSGYSGSPKPKLLNKYSDYPASFIRIGYLDLTGYYNDWIIGLNGQQYHMKYIKTIERL